MTTLKRLLSTFIFKFNGRLSLVLITSSSSYILQAYAILYVLLITVKRDWFEIQSRDVNASLFINDAKSIVSRNSKFRFSDEMLHWKNPKSDFCGRIRTECVAVCGVLLKISGFQFITQDLSDDKVKNQNHPKFKRFLDISKARSVKYSGKNVNASLFYIKYLFIIVVF